MCSKWICRSLHDLPQVDLVEFLFWGSSLVVTSDSRPRFAQLIAHMSHERRVWTSDKCLSCEALTTGRDDPVSGDGRDGRDDRHLRVAPYHLILATSTSTTLVVHDAYSPYRGGSLFDIKLTSICRFNLWSIWYTTWCQFSVPFNNVKLSLLVIY